MRGLGGAVRRFRAADGFFLAAGLAFFFLVCVIPLVLLGVATLGFVLSDREAGQAVVEQLTRNMPVYEREIRRALLRIVETRQTSGVLGTLILVVVSTPLFTASRLVLHRVLEVRSTRGFLRSVGVDAAMVLALGVLLFALSLVGWIFHWLEGLMPTVGGGGWRRVGPVLLGALLSTGTFFLWYRYVPHRALRPGAALRGAVLAGLAWEVAKQLFRLYVVGVGVYDQIYGSLAILVVFVSFVYYTAVVFVLGAAYAGACDAAGAGGAGPGRLSTRPRSRRAGRRPRDPVLW